MNLKFLKVQIDKIMNISDGGYDDKKTRILG